MHVELKTTANNNEELKRTINGNAMMQQPTTLGKRTQKIAKQSIRNIQGRK